MKREEAKLLRQKLVRASPELRAQAERRTKRFRATVAKGMSALEIEELLLQKKAEIQKAEKELRALERKLNKRGGR
jgi:HAMP domain-containing protein